MLELYHWYASTCSKRVRICLAEKGLDWTSHHIRLDRGEQFDPDYVKLNPAGVIPTLIHDGKILTESLFIMEYLDDVFPEPSLRPADPIERHQMRIWMDRSENVLHRSVNVISFIRQGRYKRYEGMTEEELQEAFSQQPDMQRRAILENRVRNGVTQADMDFAEARIAEIFDDMEERLSDGRPWLCGDGFSLADISYAPFIERFQANQMDKLVDWNTRPNLGGWWARVQERPGFQTGFFFPNPDA